MSDQAIPGVGTLSSTALTFDQLNGLWQDLILQILGFTPSGPTDPVYGNVRLDWQTQGQPAWGVGDDLVFLEVVEEPDSYNVIHEQSATENDDESFTQTTVYTRVQRVIMHLYGPNSGDRARLIKSCMYFDFVHDKLAASNLYLITEFSTPRRIPEIYATQYFERSDFSVRMNEQVTETLVLPSIASVEVITSGGDITTDETIEL